MSGLLTQIKGLIQYLRQGYYKVRIGSKYLNEDKIKTSPLSLSKDCIVHFTPVISGAGKAGGIIQVVAGVALIAAAWWNPLGWSTATALAVGFTGASMALSGAITLLAKPPDISNHYENSEKKQSTAFSNLRNLTPQGRPIPILLGKMMTSIVLISQGVEAFDDNLEEKLEK
ncbi:phage tail protein [Pasteurellaceae bacterium Macca]|nr:phage tail protein [Pasteurellaceae bacterium Macca]MCK3656449.1 phage tail protein [Pasteurellaceae bacterium Macca]MCK3656745.1 phage tail protein [Pasteurellaceae bacterium Macca]MCK3657081.1 phage tail protein [Pasteurellaceae bacterium Macca]